MVADSGDAGITARIVECRRAKKITQEELAKAIGVTKSAVSAWEQGRSLPSVEKFNALAEILGTTPGYLFFGENSGLRFSPGEAIQALEEMRTINMMSIRLMRQVLIGVDVESSKTRLEELHRKYERLYLGM